MKREIFIPLIVLVIGCLLIGCQGTHDEEKTPDSASDTQVYEESEKLLGMTFRDIRAYGMTLKLSYFEGGGSPVYEISGLDGMYLVFPAMTDGADDEAAEESVKKKYPVKLLIQSDGVAVPPGIKVGMTAGEVIPLEIKWDDVYMSSENSLYYTSFDDGADRITAAWAIPEDMFSTWAAGIGDEDDYYAEFLKFIQPFKDKPVGTVAWLAIERIK